MNTALRAERGGPQSLTLGHVFKNEEPSWSDFMWNQIGKEICHFSTVIKKALY